MYSKNFITVAISTAFFWACFQPQTTCYAADDLEAPFRAELVDELEDLFPDSKISEPPAETFFIDAARGTTVAVHIFVKEICSGQTMNFSIQREGKDVRGARWFRLVDVPVEVNTGLETRTELHDGKENPYVIRRAPFRVYEALEPVQSPVQLSQDVLALRVELPLAKNHEPGEHQYNIILESGDSKKELSLNVRVYAAVVPPAGRDTLHFTNWFSCGNMAKYHDVEPWSEAHWEIIRKYARLMARERQNTFWIVWHDFFEKQPDGRWLLNREKLRRSVYIFLGEGIYYIEGGQLAGRHGGDWNAETFDLVLSHLPATSQEGNAALADMTRQIMEEIRANGWKNRWLQHIADEPIDANAADYRILCGMVRKYMPGIPLVEATMNLKIAGAVDIWCPQVQEYQKHREAFDAFREQGDRIWVYTCLSPGGPWINRLLDQERMRPMLIGWAAALYDLDGFLHWGLNHYGADPFEKSVVPHHSGEPKPENSLPAGDTHIVYPGSGGPWSSLRFEAHRIGLEDRELLEQLKEKDSEQADKIMGRVIRGFDDYTKDPAVYRAAKKELLEALGSS
ncbi:MAG: DUF4091 domain-containing protein [Candidatus Hinthialibacter sp.]